MSHSSYYKIIDQTGNISGLILEVQDGEAYTYKKLSINKEGWQDSSARSCRGLINHEPDYLQSKAFAVFSEEAEKIITDLETQRKQKLADEKAMHDLLIRGYRLGLTEDQYYQLQCMSIAKATRRIEAWEARERRKIKNKNILFEDFYRYLRFPHSSKGELVGVIRWAKLESERICEKITKGGYWEPYDSFGEQFFSKQGRQKLFEKGAFEVIHKFYARALVRNLREENKATKSTRSK